MYCEEATLLVTFLDVRKVKSLEDNGLSFWHGVCLL
jgi:hypothetical protein